jgi:geranylgeranyl reductase family protein
VVTTNDFDIAIVGGGPAGSTCALTLHSLNPSLRVCIIDKAIFPRDKTCGDGIGPGVWYLSRVLGIEDLYDDYATITHFRLSGPSGQVVDSALNTFKKKVFKGIVVPRMEFDSRLYKRIKEKDISYFEGLKLQKIDYDRDEAVWALDLRPEHSNADKEDSIRARILIGADGAFSQVRKYLGIPRNSDRHTGIAIRAYARAKKGYSFLPKLELDYLKEVFPGYGWFFPSSPGSANLGIGMDVHQLKANKVSIKDIFETYKEIISERHQLQIVPDSVKSATLPYASELPALAHKQAALIGDAASMVNPFSGEGVFYGMYAGAILGKHLSTLRSFQEDDIKEKLTKFEAEFRRAFTRHYRINSFVKRIFRHSKTFDFFVSLTKNKVMLSMALDNMFGKNI